MFQLSIGPLALCNRPLCGALMDLVPFAQFKKRKEHPWRSVNLSKVAGLKPATLLKLRLLHGVFHVF